MRTNLTKKDIVNSLYMKLGLSKRILDLILQDTLNIIIENLKKNKKVKISNFGTFHLRHKKKREGRHKRGKWEYRMEKRNEIRY